MSTQTQETTKRGFAVPSAKKLPRLACTGKVGTIFPTYVSKTSGNYLVTPIQIDGIGASQGIRVFWLCRPEWLREDFTPASLENIEGGEKLLGTYRRHIIAPDGEKNRALLESLCGSQELYEDLAVRFFDLPEVTEESIEETLIQFFVKDGNTQELGYILRQQSKPVENKDGEKSYVYSAYYEVDKFFNNNEKGRKVQRKRADKYPDDFKVLFSDETAPF